MLTSYLSCLSKLPIFILLQDRRKSKYYLHHVFRANVFIGLIKGKNKNQLHNAQCTPGGYVVVPPKERANVPFPFLFRSRSRAHHRWCIGEGRPPASACRTDAPRNGGGRNRPDCAAAGGRPSSKSAKVKGWLMRPVSIPDAPHRHRQRGPLDARSSTVKDC
jgi:hypothetical protein